MIRPPALHPGARVALVAPAGPMTDEAVDRAVDRVHAWGWEPVLGQHARAQHAFLAGTDEQRRADLVHALLADDIDAVWCLRGGYGVMRLLDMLPWEEIRHHPRPLIGFSDNTALHLALQRLGIVSFHGPHPGALEFPRFSEEVLLRALSPEPAGVLPFPPEGPSRAETLVGGSAEGRLVGGNLSLIAATLGTPYAIQSRGALLFLEEVGEPPYRVDRMLTHLQLAGVFREIAGVVVGDMEASAEGDVNAVLQDRLGQLGVPVATGFPFGHIDNNWTIPLGVHARLDADGGTLELLEPAVA
ncbi:MAG: LD-carboxypeptidase [Gemmatimonadota bacterium]|nr:LD-carboxypeptidase [Gemmatimonadota bacterium]